MIWMSNQKPIIFQYTDIVCKVQKWRGGSRWILLLAAAWIAASPFPAWAIASPNYSFQAPGNARPPDPQAVTVIGHTAGHTITKGETLLDVARNFGLGFNELEDLYPDLDPWVPTPGKRLILPSMWVLPDGARTGIVINVAEFRLFHYLNDGKRVRTYPVGIGDEEWNSPVGAFRVMDKRINPTWYIPPSLRQKYHPVLQIPPGPENPLGDYFIGIGNAYGIHGTDIPWSVGRLVTHGCIRMYPEDIRALFPTVAMGTPVQIVYEPVKIGLLDGRVYVEAHRDVYNKIPDYFQYGYQRLIAAGLMAVVEPAAFEEALERKSGIPEMVGSILGPPDSPHPPTRPARIHPEDPLRISAQQPSGAGTAKPE